MKIECWACGKEQETESQHVAVCGVCQAVIRIAGKEPEKPARVKRGRPKKHKSGILPEHCGGGIRTLARGIQGGY